MNIESAIQAMLKQVPPVPSPDFQREPTEPAWTKEVPRVPPVPPEKTKVKPQSPPGHQSGPFVTIEQLPERLSSAATRVCRELWNDTDEAVQAMLADLTWNDPADWEALISHFEQQLPPPKLKAIPMVQCAGCSHAAPSPHHPAIMHCKASVESGAATGGWFDTDKHFCDRREAQ